MPRLDRAFTDDEVEALVAWCESAIQEIREHSVAGRAAVRLTEHRLPDTPPPPMQPGAPISVRGSYARRAGRRDGQ